MNRQSRVAVLWLLVCFSLLMIPTDAQFMNVIRVALPAPPNPSTVQFLTLCEVQVEDGRGDLYNLTNAQQSTTRVGPEGPNLAEWAIDGDTSSNFNDLSCTHTAGGADNAPFWTAEFESEQPLGTINVIFYNRNVVPERLGGAVVTVNSQVIGTLGIQGQNPDTDGDNIITVGVTGSPTTSPTTSEPTNQPSNSPTQSPTTSPSSSPTTTPSAAPTSSPTKFPTDAPTGSPTSMPTRAPTTTPPDDLLSVVIIAAPAGGGALLLLLAVVLLIRRRKRSPRDSVSVQRTTVMTGDSGHSSGIDIKNPMFAGDSETGGVGKRASAGSPAVSFQGSGFRQYGGYPTARALERVSNRASLKTTTIPRYSQTEIQELSKQSTQRMLVIEDFKADYDDEISAQQGTILTIVSKINDDWYQAYDPKSGKSGIIPLSFLQKV